MNKFIPQYEPLILNDYCNAVHKQIESGWIGTSKSTLDFENKIKDITNIKNVISTTSGTMAFFLGIAALDIPRNKKIIFPSYTFLAGANVLKHFGYEILFVDINRETLCLDVELTKKALQINNDVGAIVFVDHNAYVGKDRTLIKDLCDSYDIPFIEDSAQALGIPDAGKLGIFSIFSFSVPKLVTTGQGGVVLTDDDNLANKMRQMRDHGDNWRSDKIHKFIGLNLKFNDMAAAIGLEQLSNLPDLLTRRKQIFDAYRNTGIKIIDYGYDSTWMVIYPTKNANIIIDELLKYNIQAVKYYRPIPENPPFKNDDKYLNAEYVYENYLYLPSSLNLNNEDIEYICNIIKEIDND